MACVYTGKETRRDAERERGKAEGEGEGGVRTLWAGGRSPGRRARSAALARLERASLGRRRAHDVLSAARSATRQPLEQQPALVLPCLRACCPGLPPLRWLHPRCACRRWRSGAACRCLARRVLLCSQGRAAERPSPDTKRRSCCRWRAAADGRVTRRRAAADGCAQTHAAHRPPLLLRHTHTR